MTSIEGRAAVEADGTEPAADRLRREGVEVIGVVDGTRDCTTTTFWVVTGGDASVELDDLVAVDQVLPDADTLTHYGIVVGLERLIEGASWSSDTARVSARTMPGETARLAEVRVLRPYPERWVAPEPAQEVRRAAGEERARALFMDQMDHSLAVGLDAREQPVHVDFDFVNGRKGGHVNVSGISGVATKTTSLLALLYLLFETAEGRRLLGLHADQTRALVVSVKNEDLLHIDRANRRLREDDARRWRLLGAEHPGPFSDVGLYVPPRPGSENVVPFSETRVQPGEVTAFGWTPWQFVTQGLLAFLLADADDALNQLSFVEQRVRTALVRWAWPAAGQPGAVVLRKPDDHPPSSFERVQRHVAGRQPRAPGSGGQLVRDFGELVDFVEARFDDQQADFVGNLASQTIAAFSRRLSAMATRIGHLVRLGVAAPVLEHQVTVVDIHSLHDSAQRFVVGALVEWIFQEKQGSGREPLRLVMLDELNKFCPDRGRSPLKELLVDIAERGRSMGVILLGAQQHAGGVDATVIRNASVKLVGRLDAGDLDAYRFLPPEMRERATLFVPGSMVLHQPVVPAPIPIRVPFPPFATAAEEAVAPEPDPRDVDPFNLPGAG
jgi:DNA helicase HerA-like ATPase